MIAHKSSMHRTVLDNAADMIETDATPLDHYEKRELAALAQKVLAELPTDLSR